MKSLTIKVRMDTAPGQLSPPGMLPADPVVKKPTFDMPQFGIGKNSHVVKIGPYSWDLVFDFVPTTEPGRYLLHCLRTGTGRCFLANRPPFREADIRVEFDAPDWLYREYPRL